MTQQQHPYTVIVEDVVVDLMMEPDPAMCEVSELCDAVAEEIKDTEVLKWVRAMNDAGLRPVVKVVDTFDGSPDMVVSRQREIGNLVVVYSRDGGV